MNRQNIANSIVSVPDWPASGVLFRDITSLLADANVHRAAVADMIGWARNIDFGAVVGIESRGFIFAAPIALELGLPLVLARKPGKLPRPTLSENYDLEYGQASLHITQGTVPKNRDVLIVDDIIATGGTVRAAMRICERMGAAGIAVCALADITALGGVDSLRRAGALVHTVVEY